MNIVWFIDFDILLIKNLFVYFFWLNLRLPLWNYGIQWLKIKRLIIVWQIPFIFLLFLFLLLIVLLPTIILIVITNKLKDVLVLWFNLWWNRFLAEIDKIQRFFIFFGKCSLFHFFSPVLFFCLFMFIRRITIWILLIFVFFRTILPYWLTDFRIGAWLVMDGIDFHWMQEFLFKPE